MSVLVNKLTLNDTNSGTLYECECYTTTKEAIPTSVTNGSCWEIKNNNVVCYLGLWPKTAAASKYSTPLIIKENNIEYYVQTKVVNEFTVTIVQSDHQTIKVTCNGKEYTSTFTAAPGSQYTTTVTADQGYIAGTPSSSSGYVNSDITISASPASIGSYTITVNQTSNQTINVVYNGKTYTSTFAADYNTKITSITVSADTGYNPGTVSVSGLIKNSDGTYTVQGNATITASAASIIMCAITITQTANQTITVNDHVNNKDYTSTFSAAYGTLLGTTITPATGYNAGDRKITGDYYLDVQTNGLFHPTGSVSVTATAATAKSYLITITQPSGATITCTYKGTKYTSSFNALYGETYTVSATTTEGYTITALKVGSTVITSGSTQTVSGAVTISATTSKNTYPVTIVQSSNQTITVSCNGTDYTESFNAEHGLKYTAKITAVTGYTAGTLSSTSGTITGAVTISATAATINTYSVTINQTSNQVISCKCNGTSYNKSFTAEYNSIVSDIIITPSTGYDSGTLSIEGGLAYTSGRYYLRGNATISASNATLKVYTFTLPATTNQTITVKVGSQTYTSTSSVQTFNITHGQTWSATIAGATGYNPGTLSATSGTASGDITLTVTAATLKTYTVTIVQPTNGKITVTYNSKEYTSNFTATHGSTLSLLCTPNSGYKFVEWNLSNSTALSSVEEDIVTAAVIEKNEDM